MQISACSYRVTGKIDNPERGSATLNSSAQSILSLGCVSLLLVPDAIYCGSVGGAAGDVIGLVQHRAESK